MKTKESEGFFCVVYFTNEKKTVWYRKTWCPGKLADHLISSDKPWLWIKSYIDKQTYFADSKAPPYAIFDKNNPISYFTFKPFTKKIN